MKFFAVGATFGALPSVVLAIVAPDAYLAPVVPFAVVGLMFLWGGGLRRRLLARIPPLPVSRAVGKALRWMIARAIQALLWLAVTCVSGWLTNVLLGNPLSIAPVSWADVGRILALLVTLLALLMTLRARRGMVVEEFADYTAAAPARTRGLAPVLMHELDQLAALHRAVDEHGVVATAVGKAQAIEASITVDGNSDFLHKDFSAEEQLRVGPLSIPLRVVAAALRQLSRGPRLSGSLHRHGDVLTLIARTSGLRPAQGWRVERRIESTFAAADLVDDMASELACRAFTDLALSGTLRWTATRCFAEGLESYRASLRSAQDRVRLLRDAERSFLEAASQDRRFDLAYYNLGVVYLSRIDGWQPRGRSKPRSGSTRSVWRPTTRWHSSISIRGVTMPLSVVVSESCGAGRLMNRRRRRLTSSA